MGRANNAKYCCHRCCKEANKKPHHFSHRRAFPELSGTAVGAIGELAVARELMERGFYVYRAMDAHAPFDLVAVKGKKVYRVEATTGYENRNTERVYCSKRGNGKNSRYDVLGIFVDGQKVVFEPEDF